MRSRKRLIVALSSLVALLAGATFAYGEVIRSGNLELTVDGGVKPKKLPKKKMAPIKLDAEGHIRTLDGSTPPIADKVVVDFDKNGRYFNKGFPTCNPRKLINRNTRTAKRKCRKALIGRGKTRAIVDFPDQEPFDAVGPLLIFNGPNKGKKKQVIFHVYANVPLPTAFVVPGVMKKTKGRYGTRLTVNVPTISGGSGTLVDFDATVNKKYKVKKRKRNGKKKVKKYSILEARCANGRFLAKGEVTWRGGEKINVGIVRECKQKKSKRNRNRKHRRHRR